MRIPFCAVAVAILLGAVSVGRATLINFDNVPSGTLVANAYPGVNFSVETGLGLSAYAFAYLGPSPFSSPNVLTCYDGVGRSPTSVPDVYADFTTPVNGLTFLAVASDEFGTVARVNVFSGPTLLGATNITGNGPSPGNFGNAAVASTLVNLTAYLNVTRIEIIPPIGQTDLDSSYGGGGLVFDNFSFDPIPEPAAWTLVPLGLALCALQRRMPRSAAI